MDTKLRSTYNQLGENHDREAKEIQQTVQIRRHPDVREWRQILLENNISYRFCLGRKEVEKMISALGGCE